MTEQTLKNKTAKGLAWGFLNNSTMQVLNAVFGIILARRLSQADYGLIGMLTIFTAIASSLQDSGFVTALTNKKDASHADYNSVFWFNISVSASMYALFFVTAPLLAEFYHEPLLKSLFRYYSLGFFAASFSIVPRAILFKQLRQKELAVVSVVALLISGTIGVAMAFMDMAYWGLATQNLLYIVVTVVLSWWLSGWRPCKKVTFAPVREMFAFSSKMLITNIFYQINQNVFSVILGKIYTKSEVGVYNQANKWNTIGVSSIYQMVQGVAQPTFVSVGDDVERLRRAFSKLLRFTCFVSFPALFGLSMVAPEFIVILLGEKWLSSADLLRIICIGSAFQPVSLLFSNMVISRGKSDVYMWNVIAQGIALVASILVIHALDGDIRMMVWSYVGIMVSWLLIWIYFVWREIKITVWQTMKDIVPFIAMAAVTMFATFFATDGIANLYLLLGCRVAMAVVVYAVLAYVCATSIVKESLGFILKK